MVFFIFVQKKIGQPYHGLSDYIFMVYMLFYFVKIRQYIILA